MTRRHRLRLAFHDLQVHQDFSGLAAAAAAPQGSIPEMVEEMPSAPALVPLRAEHKVGRNDPCPCGSGKKYKKCCGA